MNFKLLKVLLVSLLLSWSSAPVVRAMAELTPEQREEVHRLQKAEAERLKSLLAVGMCNPLLNLMAFIASMNLNKDILNGGSCELLNDRGMRSAMDACRLLLDTVSVLGVSASKFHSDIALYGQLPVMRNFLQKSVNRSYVGDAFWGVFDVVSLSSSLYNNSNLAGKKLIKTDVSCINSDVLAIVQKNPDSRSAEEWESLSDCWCELMQNLTPQRWYWAHFLSVNVVNYSNSEFRVWFEGLCIGKHYVLPDGTAGSMHKYLGMLSDADRTAYLDKEQKQFLIEADDYTSIRKLAFGILGIDNESVVYQKLKELASLYKVESQDQDQDYESELVGKDLVIKKVYDFFVKSKKVVFDDSKATNSKFVRAMCIYILPAMEQICSAAALYFSVWGDGSAEMFKKMSLCKTGQAIARTLPEILMSKGFDKMRLFYAALLVAAVIKCVLDFKAYTKNGEIYKAAEEYTSTVQELNEAVIEAAAAGEIGGAASEAEAARVFEAGENHKKALRKCAKSCISFMNFEQLDSLAPLLATDPASRSRAEWKAIQQQWTLLVAGLADNDPSAVAIKCVAAIKILSNKSYNEIKQSVESGNFGSLNTTYHNIARNLHPDKHETDGVIFQFITGLHNEYVALEAPVQPVKKAPVYGDVD
ncbi:MAG: hypothetical protein US49_C0006G0049 [candidate division TM6 bacterium GW2011_GWF2_37_49]|nr:MAG: hypothetical protein US49_C0006G0049 [candidate division TM6 bacterium GW2011_GWF2_37_49]